MFSESLAFFYRFPIEFPPGIAYRAEKSAWSVSSLSLLAGHRRLGAPRCDEQVSFLTSSKHAGEEVICTSIRPGNVIH